MVLKIKRGFTLIEIMIVVTIITILVATIIPKFRASEQINPNTIMKVMVTTDRCGYNTYKAIDKNGKINYINEKQFGKLVSSGVEVIK